MIELPPEKSNSEPVSGTRRWLLFGGGALLLLACAFWIDGSIDRWVTAHRLPAWHAAARICSRYLAWHWLMGMAACGLVTAWLCRRRDWMRVICAMMVAASLAGLSADLLRGITGRTRPYYKQVPQGFYGVHDGGQWLITKHAYNAFPSGHTAAMTGFTLPLLFWRRWFACLAVPVIAAVAAARIYLGAHHFSDVIAGAILGSLVAAWVWRRVVSGFRSDLSR